MIRRFELAAEEKFWQIEQRDLTLRVSFGKIGHKGQLQLKRCDSDAGVRAETERLVAEKVKKGFVEIADATGETTAAAPAPAKKPKPNPPAPPAVAAHEHEHENENAHENEHENENENEHEHENENENEHEHEHEHENAHENAHEHENAHAHAAAKASPALTPATKTPPARATIAAASSTVASIDTSSRLFQSAAPLAGTKAPFKPKPASDSFRRLHERYAKLAAAFEAGAKESSGPMKERLTAVTKAYEGEMPGALDIDTEAAAYRLFSSPSGYRDDHGGELFGRYWVAKGGGDFAFRALARAEAFTRKAKSANTWSEPMSLWLEESTSTELPTWQKSDDVWIPLREWASSLDASELAELRARVVALRTKMHVSVRALIDAALGDASLCAEDAAELAAGMGTNNHAPMTLWPTLFAMDDANALLALLETLPPYAMSTSVDYLPNLVVRLGTAAAPIVTRILERARELNYYGADRMKQIAQVLALIRTPEVAAVMAANLEHKELRAIATEYLLGSPALGLAALAHRAIGKGATADLAKSVLGSVVGKSPDDARRIAGEVDGAERALIESALDRFDNLVDADPSELPRVLASPPWLEKKRAQAARVVAGLKPLPYVARIVWKNEAQHTEFKNERSYYATNPAQEKDILKEIADAQKAGKTAAIGSYKLVQLPKASALQTLETVPLNLFTWYYGGIASAFIGRWGVDALPAVLRYATMDPANAIEALTVVDTPEVAPLMADAFMRLKKSRANAQAWLLAFSEAAAIGLIPAAIGDRAGSRPPAMAALRYLATHGKRDVLERVAEKYGADAKAAVGDVLDFDPLTDLPAKLPKMPSFFNASALARPHLAGTKKVLSVAAVDALGTMLAFPRVDAPYAGIGHVKEACDKSSLAQFAWELFQSWLVAGAPSKEQWAFLALGEFGGDEEARKLTPLVRAWPGEAAHARAVTGLDVLAAIGTDVALMHLHGIAQKVKFKGLQERAREKIDQIAEARGLTADELADRLVPDLGLDDDGSLALDFGSRKFRVVFDETLKPAVLDESGKRMSDLPKPNKSDEPEKSAEAVATWKAMKKDAKTVATSQLLRLELAMCSGRRWETDAFDTFFVQHPLLIHLVRRLVWGAYGKAANGAEALVGTFRLAEDKSFADTKDALYTVPSGARIGLVHRLEMDQKEADAWGQVFGDYEIMQPFAQLSREALRPEQDETNATDLTRVDGITVPTGKVLGLDSRGWRRGPPQDGGVVCWYEKPLGDGFIACLALDPGIYTQMIAESPQQKLGKVVVAKDADSWRRDSLKTMGELSAIEFSEMVRDLESVRP